MSKKKTRAAGKGKTKGERAPAVRMWCIRRRWSGARRRTFLLLSTVAFSRRGAWACFLSEPDGEFSNTPRNRAMWRRRGARAVRVVVREVSGGRGS